MADSAGGGAAPVKRGAKPKGKSAVAQARAAIAHSRVFRKNKVAPALKRRKGK